MIVAAYAWLLLAARPTWAPAGFPDALPPPQWRARRSKPHATTLDLIQHLRAELWGHGLRRFCGFPPTPSPTPTPKKLSAALPTALLYASP